ncbi:MAG: VacJ family lipoprotein [Dongiaceae bacterium]
MPRAGWIGLALAAMVAVAGCAKVPEGDPEALAAFQEANDPLEPMNRYFFEVNYALDELLLKPIAGWYYVALPNPVQDSIRNFLRNINTPVVLANDLMQGSLDRAGDTSMRFLINTTFGVLGLFDVASGWGYPFHDEDFGQTLAVHGVDEGPYLMLPVMGPSNPRDAIGTAVDNYIDPLTYVLPAHNLGYLLYIRAAVGGIDLRARNLKTLDEIRKNSLDYYATIRSLYRQVRNDEIRNGAPGDTQTFPGAVGLPDGMNGTKVSEVN